MIKKIAMYFVMLVTISMMSNVELYAQSRIRFAKGRSSATVSGTIPAGGSRTFVAGASSGQNARISVSPRNINIFTREAPKGNAGSTDFDMNDGDNTFEIYNPSNRAVRYTMTISIR